MKKKITNTHDKFDPMAFIATATMIGASAAIEREEKHGQRELVQSDQLPLRGWSRNFYDAFIAAGGTTPKPTEIDTAQVTFKKGVDPLFIDVTLPPGWEKKDTDHSMWSSLLDARGNKRAGIFYKAASYDRNAHMSPNSRFLATYGCEDNNVPEADRLYYPLIQDFLDKELWRGAFIKGDKAGASDKYYAAERNKRDANPRHEFVSFEYATDKARVIAAILLKKLYPECDNVAAYWDIDPVFPTSLSQPLPGLEYVFDLDFYKIEKTSMGYHGTLSSEELVHFTSSKILRKFEDKTKAVDYLLDVIFEQYSDKNMAEIRATITQNGKAIDRRTRTYKTPKTDIFYCSGPGMFDQPGIFNRRPSDWRG